jgi:hypothetical protein
MVYDAINEKGRAPVEKFSPNFLFENNAYKNAVRFKFIARPDDRRQDIREGS